MSDFRSLVKIFQFNILSWISKDNDECHCTLARFRCNVHLWSSPSLSTTTEGQEQIVLGTVLK